MPIDEEITLRKLEVFLCFMRHGSMSAVAEAMDLSTVSVHRALHSLQEGLRCPLFKKEGRSLIPLAAAYTFAEFAEKSVKECEEGIRRTRLTAGFEATRIVIGSAYSLTVKAIPQLIFGLKSRRPQLDVDLKLGSTRELLDRLKEGATYARHNAARFRSTVNSLGFCGGRAARGSSPRHWAGGLVAGGFGQRDRHDVCRSRGGTANPGDREAVSGTTTSGVAEAL